MLSAEEQQILELLRAIPPLLPPDLTCSPPTSPRPIQNGSTGSQKRKRTSSEAATTNGRVLGLGIAVDGHDGAAGSEDGSRKPAPPLAPSSRVPPPPPPPANSTKPVSSSQARESPRLTTPRLPHAGGTRESPMLGTAKNERIEAEWRKEWPRDRLRKLAAQCRDHGRKLKHAGDALARASASHSRQTTLLAMAHHIDSILLYVFSFWCDDTANKNCNVQQWASVYGLVAFVKKQAQQENVPVVLGLCYRMEAIAVFTTSMHEQKALHHKATQLLHGASASTSALQTPRAPPPPPLPSGPPPPPPPPPPAAASSHAAGAAQNAGSPASLSTSTGSSHPASPAPNAPPALRNGSHPPPPPPPPLAVSNNKATEDALRGFVKASPDLFRFQRLYDSSSSTLSPALLSTFYPRTWALCTTTPPAPSETNGPKVLAAFVLPNKPWRFAWPAELGRGTLGHQIAWARALVEEWAEAEGLEYEVGNVAEGV